MVIVWPGRLTSKASVALLVCFSKAHTQLCPVAAIYGYNVVEMIT